MASRLFEETLKKREMKRLENISPYIFELAARGNVTLGEFKDLRINLWEEEELYPAIEDDVLLWIIERSLKNCSPRSCRSGPAITYDEAIIHVLVPELVRRLKKRDDGSSRFTPDVTTCLERNQGVEGQDAAV